MFIDARSGDLYTPGQENARITSDQAKNIVTEAFPLLPVNRVRVIYSIRVDSVRAWIFTMFRDNTTILTGAIDPETGQILSFTRNVSWEGRQTDPLLDINAAQKIADRYIFDKNGGSLSLNMTESQYIPLRVPQKTVPGATYLSTTELFRNFPAIMMDSPFRLMH